MDGKVALADGRLCGGGGLSLFRFLFPVVVRGCGLGHVFAEVVLC